MHPIRSILVALDLTPEGDAVWREACALARRHEAELHLVHAVNDLGPRDPAVGPALDGAEARLLALRRAALEDGVRVAPGVLARAGDAADTIRKAALDLGVDLVVIGANARSADDRALLGMTAERLVHEAPLPVWIVRPGRPPARLQRIVAVVDAAAPQREVLQAAGLVARPERLGLTVLSLTPEPDRADLLARVRDAIGGTAAESLDVEVHARPAARPVEELLALATRDGVDLLVIGEPHGRGLLRRRRADPVDGLLRVVPCSILHVPRAPAPAGAARG